MVQPCEPSFFQFSRLASAPLAAEQRSSPVVNKSATLTSAQNNEHIELPLTIA